MGFWVFYLCVTYIGVEPAGYCVAVAVWRALGIVGPVPGDGHVVRRRVAALSDREGRQRQCDEVRSRNHASLPDLKPSLALSDGKGRGIESDCRVTQQLSNRVLLCFCSEAAAGHYFQRRHLAISPSVYAVSISEDEVGGPGC